MGVWGEALLQDDNIKVGFSRDIAVTGTKQMTHHTPTDKYCDKVFYLWTLQTVLIFPPSSPPAFF